MEFVGIVDEMKLRTESGNCNSMRWRREITVIQHREKLDRMEIQVEEDIKVGVVDDRMEKAFVRGG